MSAKKILAFYLEGCPYCRQAREALRELATNNANIEWVEENQYPDISAKYDYYHVPSMFIDGKKIYEAHPGESYEECKENVKRVLEAANGTL